MTNSIEELEQQDVIFITGSNPTEAHPVIGARIRQARQRGAKLIVADPRRIELANEAEIFLQIRPGTNIALYNSMMNVILEEGLEDRAYIQEKCEGFDELAATVKEYTPEKSAKICGVSAEEIRKAARMYATAKKAGIYYCLGVTEFSTGVQGVMTLSNLALTVGKVGKESCGVNPIRGQNNVQGACDMGALPGDFPGYQKVANEAVIEKFKKAWGKDELSGKPGLMTPEMMSESGGKIKMLYIFGENPMIADPDINHVRKCLGKLDFLVVQDIFLTETAELADVVLPAACFAEKDGTFTNTERRVQRVRKAVEPPGQAKEDWKIISELSRRLGYENKFTNAREIMDEIASVAPSYGGIDYDRLENIEGLQWPCPTKDHGGTRFLHASQFARAGGKALFKPTVFTEPKEMPDAEYPFILSTGRNLYHYNAPSMTGKSDGINKLAGTSYIEISPNDAERLGIKDQEKVKVSSRRGELTTKARILDILKDGVVFMTFHYADGAANLLTNNALDDISKTPEYKACACKIEKIGA